MSSCNLNAEHLQRHRRRQMGHEPHLTDNVYLQQGWIKRIRSYDIYGSGAATSPVSIYTGNGRARDTRAVALPNRQKKARLRVIHYPMNLPYRLGEGIHWLAGPDHFHLKQYILPATAVPGPDQIAFLFREVFSIRCYPVVWHGSKSECNFNTFIYPKSTKSSNFG